MFGTRYVLEICHAVLKMMGPWEPWTVLKATSTASQHC